MNHQINTDKILYSQVGEEGVIYDITKNEYIALNETFFKILQGIEAGKSKPEIVANLCAEYSIPEADCAVSVDKSINQLAQKEYIKTA